MSTRWLPYGPHLGGSNRPEEGDVVAIERAAWKVIRYTDAAPTPEERERAATAGPWADRYRPYELLLQRLHGPAHDAEDDRHVVSVCVPGDSYPGIPVYPHGRVPLCSCCGHPWPCRIADEQATAEAALKRAEKAMRVMPGCCPACNEPITTRQRSIRFGGPNLLNPLAEGPTYHTRGRCWHAASRYEQLWVAAEPGRPRSLLTLQCEGTLIVHGDGTAECHGAKDSDCPSIYARHRCMGVCYTQSAGCPRDCPVRGHPGCEPSGRPADPRAVTRIEGGS